MRINRTVTSSKPISEVFRYLSDFTSTNDWDPGTVKTSKVQGDGKVGTVYENRSKFNGRESDLIYIVTDYEENKMIRLRGENKSIIAVDTITFRENNGKVEVTYDANFTLKGIAKIAGPFLGKAFKILGDEAEVGLRKALN